MKKLIFVILLSFLVFSEPALDLTFTVSPKEIYSGEAAYFQVKIKNNGDAMDTGGILVLELPDFEQNEMKINVPPIEAGKSYELFQEVYSLLDIRDGLREIRHTFTYGEKTIDGFESIKILRNPLRVSVNSFAEKMELNKISKLVVSVENTADYSTRDVSIRLVSDNLTVTSNPINISLFPAKSSFTNLAFDYSSAKEGSYNMTLEVLFNDEKGDHKLSKTLRVIVGGLDSLMILLAAIVGVLGIAYFTFFKHKKK